VGLLSVFGQKTPVKKKIILIIFGIFLSMVLLEAGLRTGGTIILSLQEYRNRVSVRQKGEYLILCLGESTTFYAWPYPLEEILNQRHIGIKFSVIDKGVPGVTTTGILARVEDYLDRYNPDMVITMMGINDSEETVPYENTFSKKIILFLKMFKTYKLANLLWLRINNKLGNTGDGEPATKAATSAKAEDLAQQNSFKEQKKINKKSVEKNPEIVDENECDDSGIWICFKGDRAKTEELLKRCIEINPNNVRLHIGLGMFYSLQGEYDKAEETLKRAIDINPEGSEQAYTTLGLSYKDQWKYDKAEEMFKKAIKINPEYKIPYFELARLYMNRGEYDNAAELLNKAAKINPGNDNIYASLALCYKEQGKYKLAEEYFRKAKGLRLTNYNPVTRYNFQRLKEIVTKRGVRLVCVQYPMRNIEPLKKFFEEPDGVIFVDNEKLFKQALRKTGYKEYFKDIFAGDFGHCTDKGNRLLAENITNVILKECFNKQRP